MKTVTRQAIICLGVGFTLKHELTILPVCFQDSSMIKP